MSKNYVLVINPNIIKMYYLQLFIIRTILTEMNPYLVTWPETNLFL